MTPTNSPRPEPATWRKSSHSGDEGACVEMAELPAAVAVRDSKDPAGPHLRFTRAAWAAFAGSPPRG
jgi:hypothetical protein